MSASDTIQNNVTFSLTGVLTTTGTSVAISTDTTNGGACAFTNASILLTNQDGTIIERVRGTASSGTLTLVTRGIKQDKTLTTDSSLQKEWRPGTLGFVTTFASDTADIEGDITVNGNVVTTDTTKPGYTPQSLTQTQINALSTVGTGIVFNLTTGLYQTLVAGTWVNVASGSTPNGSTSAAGKFQAPTTTQVIAQSATGSTGALLAVTTDTLSVVSPIGEIKIWSTATAPTGFLLCDGSAVSRSTYSALFGVISTTYGSGDGSTTFNLPNLKGSVAVGYDASQTEFNTMGKTGGEKTHLLTGPESGLPAHSHNYNQYISTGGSTGGGGSFSSSLTATSTTGPTNASTAHNNLQPYVTLNYIIKY